MSLVRNYAVSLLIIVASVTRRCLGYVEIVVIEKTDLQSLTPPVDYFEDPHQNVLAGQDKIRGLYLYPVRVRKTCFENGAIRKKSLFPNPVAVRQTTERFATLPPGQNSTQGTAKGLRVTVS